jgi:predicted metal-dependent hydrolase
MSSMLFRRKPVPERVSLLLADGAVEVTVRVNPRSRSYRLTLPASGRPVLTVPPRVGWRDAEAFLLRQRDWLSARLSASPPRPQLIEGRSVPLRGVDHEIVATGSLRGHVEALVADGRAVLRVPGEPGHLERRIIDFLRAEARRDIVARTAVHASRLGVTVKAITLRGQATRWGSCSSTGRLSYNWRLIAAPPYVLDYVCAHEVAHLVEMNHSEAFWATVERALPDYRRGKAWLRTHGRALMALGA